MRIFYVDDEKRARDAFKKAHTREGTKVETCGNANVVSDVLASRGFWKRPDIIVMDLYTTNAEAGSQEADEVNSEIDRLVQKIAEVRENLDAIVKKSKYPIAINALKDLRLCRGTKNIPVIISTREGLSLLSEELFRESIQYNATWMLKGRDPASERALFRRQVEVAKTKRRRSQMNVVSGLVGAVLGWILRMAWLLK